MSVSIILPVYNVKEYLDDCLSHLQSLNSSGFEIIAVNDGSTDGSDEILKAWSKKLPLTIINQQNRGLSAARNTGLKAATGDYVVFIDSDDYVDADSLLAIYDVASQNNADITIGDYYEFTDGCTLQGLAPQSIPAPKDVVCNGSEFFERYYKPLRSVVWRNVYKRSFLIENNLLFHEGVCFEDVEFTPLAFADALKVKYSGIPFYYYRKRNNSITTSKTSEKKIRDTIEIWCVLNSNTKNTQNALFASILSELGFFSFLKQYSYYESVLPKEIILKAKQLSKNGIKSKKYRLISFIFRLIPDVTFFYLLKLLK